MAKASEIIKLAQSWIGKNEKDGSHKSIIDIYNSHKPLARNYAVTYNDWWCATFISALAIKLGCTDIIPTECGCGEMIKLCQALGIWVENDAHTPKAGDIIFYDWQDSGKGDNKGWPDHVGLVEKVSGKTITVIEGNVNDAVERRTVAVNEKGIRGYAVPKYETEPVSKPTSAPTTNEIVAGKKVTLKNTKCYSSETTASSYGTKSGEFYLWDGTEKKGRIRITNKPERVGVAGQVTCWVNVADLDLKTSTATPKPTTPANTTATQGIKAGTPYTLKDTPVYNSESGATIGKRSGTYYPWDSTVKNGRIRMTNKKERVGVSGQVSFWVDVASLK